MQRDLRRLADTSFDLVVVGGGIYGAFAAWEATMRGLRVALIDRGDFGGGTSFNSHKTLHGGLRSLQSLNARQMRLFIRERRAVAHMAPHLVRPLPYCVPTYRRLTRSTAAMRLALAITDTVAADRNRGVVDPALQLPRGRVVGRDECLALNPLIDPAGVTGGAIWSDYQMRCPERLVLSAVRSAAAGGAAVANYVEARGVRANGGRVRAVSVVDREGDASFDITTRAVLIAAGPWAGAVASALAPGFTSPPTTRLSRAMNLVVDRITDTHACGGTVRGRHLFAVPWRDVTIVGTSHDPHSGGPDDPHGTPAQVVELLADAQAAFPRARLGPSSIRLVHRGLLPMVVSTARGVSLLKESEVIDHAASGHAGLVSIFSVRYTTARHTASAAVDVVCRRLDREVAGSLTASTRVSDAVYPTVDGLISQARSAHDRHMTPDLRERLALAYGTAYVEVTALAADLPDLAAPLSSTCRVTRAEVVHAVRQEAAVTLADALLRRTDAGTAGHPGIEAVQVAGRLMAAELGWLRSRLDAEIAAVDAFYPRA